MFPSPQRKPSFLTFFWLDDADEEEIIPIQPIIVVHKTTEERKIDVAQERRDDSPPRKIAKLIKETRAVSSPIQEYVFTPMRLTEQKKIKKPE